MAFCRNCGKEIDSSIKFCPDCGASTGVDSQSTSKKAEEKFREMNDTNDYTNGFSKDDIEDNKIIALFAYLGILILVPVFGAKDSKFAKFHISQGFNLIVAAVCYSVLSGVISAIFSWLPVIGDIIGIILGVGGAFFVVLIILGIYNAVNGKAKELPLIGTWQFIKY